MDTLTSLAVAIAAILAAVLGVGRLVRVMIYDDFPPTVWARTNFIIWIEGTRAAKWSKLASCPWCLTPWVMLVCIGWFLAGVAVVWLAWAWWIFWGWMALSYVATMIYVRDEPRG